MRNLNKKKIALLTACVVSAVGHMAFAAEADNYDEYSGADYVVTATKTQLEKKEVPAAVEVITEQKIKELGAYSVQDALRLANNIDVQDNGMTGNQVQMRGNSKAGAHAVICGMCPCLENHFVIRICDSERFLLFTAALTVPLSELHSRVCPKVRTCSFYMLRRRAG